MRLLNCLPYLIYLKLPSLHLLLRFSFLVPLCLEPLLCFILFSTLSCPSPPTPFPYKTIWFPHPIQIEAFLWKIAWNRAPTLDVVQTFSPKLALLPNMCPLCLATVESTNHLFVHCRFTWRLWGRVLQLINISCALPEKAIHFISLWNSLVPCKISRKLRIFCLHALIWAIWKERNRLVFGNISGDLSTA